MRSKYGNKKTEYKGEIYDSAKEAERAFELDMLLKQGEIKSVERQPAFKIEINGRKICTYRADFKITYADGHEEIEDVKGVRTAVYRLKKKMVEAIYGIEIKET